MKIYYVTAVDEERIRTLVEVWKYPYMLLSFYDIRRRGIHAPEVWNNFYKELMLDRVELMIDSGAHHFSVEYQVPGRDYVDDYIEFLKMLEEEYVRKYRVLYVNLDLGFDCEWTWSMQRTLESKGLNPLPVYHIGEDLSYLEKYVSRYDYVGVGGMAVKDSATLYRLKEFLISNFGLASTSYDEVVRQLKDRYFEPNKVKMHTFAKGDFDFLVRVRPYSTDSGQFVPAYTGVLDVKNIIGKNIEWSFKPKDTRRKRVFLGNVGFERLLVFTLLYGRNALDVLMGKTSVIETYRAPLYKVFMEVAESEELMDILEREIGVDRVVSLENIFREFLKGYEGVLNEEVLSNTPKRAAKAWKEVLSGYDVSLEAVSGKLFSVEGENLEKEVSVEIPFVSLCEHHFLPFYGTVHIRIMPDKYVLGLSKYGRLVEAVTRRLQIQERIAYEIADFLWRYLKPKGVEVRVNAVHLCCRERGVKKNINMEVVERRGVFESGGSSGEKV